MKDPISLEKAYRGKTVLVTGHTGFKGSWLCSWLLELGADVIGYSDTIPTSPAAFELIGLEHRISHNLGDICDTERLLDLLRSTKPDYLFHLAAQAIVSTSYDAPKKTFMDNAMGTISVLEALHRADQEITAVMITSDKAYDNVEWPWGYRETDALGGKDIYSGSKGAAELAIKSYFHSFFKAERSPVRVCVARAGNVIGGGDWAKDRIVADCVRAWAVGELVEIRSPNATRPWQHVLEPLSGYLTLGARLHADRSFSGESYNFGPLGEQNATVVELLKDLSKVWGSFDDRAPFVISENIPFDESRLLKLNIDKALIDLNWLPTFSYNECVLYTGIWYRDVYADPDCAHAVTRDHIRAYTEKGHSRNHGWR